MPSVTEERDMQDDPTTDLTGLISIGKYSEIKDWCAHLGCTEVELAEAIAVAGYSPSAVREFLATRFLYAQTQSPIS
jgi:hypothetical protein